MSYSRRSLLAAALAPASARVEVIAHRGEHQECPENTLPAIERALDLGCDWVEIDVRTTKDGAFVLMHNATVDATTNGQGPVTEMTLAELRSLDASGGKSGFARTRIPTLDEALAKIRGRGGVYLDAKQIPAAAIVTALRRQRLLDRAVVYGRWPLLQELTSLGHPRLAMPEAVSREVTQRILQELAPRVIAFDRQDFTPELIALARQAGKGLFVDRLGSDDTPDNWRAAAALGATGIQTDHPAALLRLSLKTSAQPYC